MAAREGANPSIMGQRPTLDSPQPGVCQEPAEAGAAGREVLWTED